MISAIAPCERPRLDLDKLELLFGQLGVSDAENVVCRAMEELALRMGHIEQLYLASARDDMRKNIRALGAIADQIGMASLARIAGDVIVCIDDCDVVALSATFARLARVCESSLMQLSELQDLSI